MQQEQGVTKLIGLPGSNALYPCERLFALLSLWYNELEDNARED